MWGRHDSEHAYFDVSELRHADAEGLPDALLRRLKIVDLPKRVGAEKVERLFGVKAIDRAAIDQTVKNCQVAVGSQAADAEFQAAKPYLYKLRTSQTSQLLPLQTLKEIRLEVCSELSAEIRYEGEIFEHDVPVWGWLNPKGGNVLYVRSDPADPINVSPALLADAISEALASMFRLGDGGEFARMLQCSERDRLLLLRKMRGESANEDIDALRAEFAAMGPDHLIAHFPVVAPPQPRTSPQEVTNDGPPVPPSGVAEPAASGASQSASSTKLQAQETRHVPASPPKTRDLVIQAVTTSDRNVMSPRRVTDGAFCELKTLEFEESDDPPRFPLLVSQVMGDFGPGCDILSFGSALEREAFRSGAARELGLVKRFIEVKGRADSSATIELKGNELSAAETYGDRYHLYRLYEIGQNAFILTMLQNPLQHKNALQPAVHVSLDRAEATRKFTLTGGIPRGQEPQPDGGRCEGESETNEEHHTGANPPELSSLPDSS
jgi:hypothetical protein